MFFYWGRFILGIPSSVGCNDLVHPGTQHGDTSVHTRWRHTAESTAPRHNSNQSPSSRLLTDQRTARVTLKRAKKTINREQESTVTMHGLHAQRYFSLRPTMHEEAPEAPAQIIRSVILLPQNWRHRSLVSRGRAACCKRAGVSGAAANKHQQSTLKHDYTKYISSEKLQTLVLWWALTIVASQAPAAGHTFHATREVIWRLSHAHRWHAYVQLGGARQLDEQDVIVDGVAIVLWVFENLTGGDIQLEFHTMSWRRRDADLLSVTHLPNFHHLDGLVTGRAIMLSKDHTVGRSVGENNMTWPFTICLKNWIFSTWHHL